MENHNPIAAAFKHMYEVELEKHRRTQLQGGRITTSTDVLLRKPPQSP